MYRVRSLLVGFLAAFALASPAFAWVYPEHRDLAVLAVQGLDPARKAAFDRLWQEARGGDGERLWVLDLR